MGGLILYSVNPRSLGELPQWNAAVQEAERLHCNTIHLNPFHPVTAARKIHHGAEVSGSLYAMTDHFTIGAEFCGGADQATAWYHLRDFIKNAGARKIRVMADLVLHHVAVDHPAVVRHPEFFKRNADGSLFVSGPADDPWCDIAAIDYTNPGAWEYFLGQDGYWLRMVDQYIDAGFSAFRCDAVYWLPQLVWEQVIHHVLRRRPDAIILAETLGLSGQDAALMRDALREGGTQVLYDLCYDDFVRNWDGRDVHALNQGRAGRLDDISRFGRMGFVDSHDFQPRAATLREFYKDTSGAVADARIAMTCLRDYAVACFTNNSVMIPRGFQYCVESNTGPFREQVDAKFFQQLKADRRAEKNILTIGSAIAELHEIRARLPREITVRLSEITVSDNENLTALECDYLDPADGRVLASIILLLNTAPEMGPQIFPDHWWRELKAQQSNARRYQFGPDRVHNGISGVALIVLPDGASAQIVLKQMQKLGMKPAAELNLVA